MTRVVFYVIIVYISREEMRGMSNRITIKLKTLLMMSNKKQTELANYLGISAQSMWNKFHRGAYTADDLIKIAEFTGATLAFELNNERIVLDVSCLRDAE